MDSAARGRLAARVLERSDADETEVIACDDRFRADALHAQRDPPKRRDDRHRRPGPGRADGRTGVASTNDLAEDASTGALARASLLASHAPRADDANAMVAAAPVAPAAGAFSAATANATAEERAAIAAQVFDVARRNDMWSAGFVSTTMQGITIGNSRGTAQSFDTTECGLAIKQNAADSTGFAERFSTEIGDLDGTAAATLAAQKAAASANPIDVPAREWTVILEPAAAGEFLDFLSSHFSAQTFDQGSSFFSGRLGERFTGENVDDRRRCAPSAEPRDAVRLRGRADATGAADRTRRRARDRHRRSLGARSDARTPVTRSPSRTPRVHRRATWSSRPANRRSTS